MLRELSTAEIGAISGGLEMEPSFEDGGFTGEGGFDGEGGYYGGDQYGSGGDGSPYGLGDMGGWSLPPGQDTPSTYGPSDNSGTPYDSSTDPNSYNYGYDPSNPYENTSSQTGTGGLNNSQLGDYNPSSSPSAPPSIGGPNPSLQGPYYNFGNGIYGGPGLYDPLNPSRGGGIQGRAQLN